jgi:hypothetical protein
MEKERALADMTHRLDTLHQGLQRTSIPDGDSNGNGDQQTKATTPRLPSSSHPKPPMNSSRKLLPAEQRSTWN